jgi:hypothetical protein
MKKSFIILTLLLTFSFVNAQDNKFAAKRASNAIAFISSEMDLTDEQAQFIEKTLYTKYADNGFKIKGKDLTDEQKKEVYRTAAAVTRKLLRQEFSNKEVMSINKLERQSFKK